MADESYRDSSGKPTLKKQKTNPIKQVKFTKKQKEKYQNQPRMDYLI